MEHIKRNFTFVLTETWPMIFISLVLLISLRIVYLMKNNKKINLHSELFLLLFIIYILFLFQVVTMQDINMSNGNNFIPFKEIFRYKLFSGPFNKNIIGNVLMFLPYGFFASKYVSGKNFILSLFLIFLASFAIESTQLVIGRIFDVDDIILNVFGGTLGFLAYNVLINIYESLPNIFKRDWFLNIMAIFILGLFIYFIVFMIS